MILFEPELHLHEHVIVPDLAGWRRELMPELPHAPAIELAPDWACEVLSPSRAKLDRAERLPVFARERVAHVWFVDPIEHYLEVLRLDGDSYRIVATYVENARALAQICSVTLRRLAEDRLWSESRRLLMPSAPHDPRGDPYLCVRRCIRDEDSASSRRWAETELSSARRAFRARRSR